MFDKIRRRSKTSASSITSIASQSSTTSDYANTSRPKNISFYDLPSELRISIFELVASDTRLSLFSSPSKHIKIPALLLATRQTRAEYRPILLSLAPIRVHIKNYNFRPLIRVVGSLYSTELKALRKNASLTIVLHLKDFNVIDRGSIDLLRRWAVKRAEYLDRLPWSYDLAYSEPRRLPMTSAMAQTCALEKSSVAVRMLQKSVHESLAAEIEPIASLLAARCVYWQAAITHAWRTGTWDFVTFD
jgi:hypothetical protein